MGGYYTLALVGGGNPVAPQLGVAPAQQLVAPGVTAPKTGVTCDMGPVRIPSRHAHFKQ